MAENLKGNSTMSANRKAGEPLTMSIPEAGWKYFGMSPNGSYKVAARGEIPVIKVGKRFRVPIAAMEQILANATPMERGSSTSGPVSGASGLAINADREGLPPSVAGPA
jgi:hypothetical protein